MIRIERFLKRRKFRRRLEAPFEWDNSEVGSGTEKFTGPFCYGALEKTLRRPKAGIF